ncbi:MAG: Sua5/YciO/YrdC/YwlC family protein [Deltaproteobacteria bacterium]|nr:Sua5/YciO/YrdC/YwlC family protein [Deltaproteobacteria bacterium]
MAGSAAESADRRRGALAARAADLLRRGGLVLAPTETLVGLLGDALRDETVRRAAALKDRPAGEPFPLLLPSSRAVARVAAAFPAPLLRLARRFWPGPLTLLLPALPGLPAGIVGPDGTVAVRVPGPSPAARIVRRFAGPLFATSANPRGRPPPADVADVAPSFREAADLVVPGRSPGGPPSTIVAWSAEGYRVVRPGAIPAAELLAAGT